jgi:N-acyl-D-amino-acid deacylase
MVRERKILTLPEAIRKMTSLPAESIGIKNRGRIKKGYFADLCVFDLEKITDNAAWESPSLPASGMDAVFTEGEPHRNVKKGASR